MMKISCGSISAKISQGRISLSENYSGFALRKLIIIFVISTSFTQQATQDEKVKSPPVAI